MKIINKMLMNQERKFNNNKINANPIKMSNLKIISQLNQ